MSSNSSYIVDLQTNFTPPPSPQDRTRLDSDLLTCHTQNVFSLALINSK